MFEVAAIEVGAIKVGAIEVGALAVVLTMGLVLIRGILGPTIYDRILAVNTFGTKTVLLLGLWGYMTGRPEFLDIALVYALINFIGTVAVLKFFEHGDLGDRDQGVPRR
ncbi:MAG: pH regulation protein F [Gammaproteobacteria bacterium]|nr:pH regulation protein F [Gammaproteobacteria bacterium]